MKKIKKELLLIVLPLCLFFYFTGIQKYTYTETMKESNEGYVHILNEKKVSYKATYKKACTPMTSKQCIKTYNYRVSLPAYVYLKMQYYAYY